MAFSKFQLTTAGTELLNRVLAENKTLTFTKFEIGDGNYTGDVKQLTSLVSKFKEFNVLDTNIVNSQVNVRAFFDNSNLEEEKYLREIGVFARIGDEVLTEVLFSYSNSGDTAELIPDKTEYFSRTLSIYSFIGDVQSVTFSIDLKIEKTDFNTKEELRITNLEIGSKVNLWGSNELGDTYKTSYIITSEVTNFQLANGLYAKLYSQPLEMGGVSSEGDTAKKIYDLAKIAYNTGEQSIRLIDGGLLEYLNYEKAYYKFTFKKPFIGGLELNFYDFASRTNAHIDFNISAYSIVSHIELGNASGNNYLLNQLSYFTRSVGSEINELYIAMKEGTTIRAGIYAMARNYTTSYVPEDIVVVEKFPVEELPTDVKLLANVYPQINGLGKPVSGLVSGEYEKEIGKAYLSNDGTPYERNDTPYVPTAEEPFLTELDGEYWEELSVKNNADKLENLPDFLEDVLIEKTIILRGEMPFMKTASKKYINVYLGAPDTGVTGLTLYFKVLVSSVSETISTSSGIRAENELLASEVYINRLNNAIISSAGVNIYGMIYVTESNF